MTPPDERRGPPKRDPFAFSALAKRNAAAFPATMTRRFLFLCSSARVNGNTQALARHAAAGLPPAAQHWLDLTAPPLPPYHDIRPRHAPPEGPMADLMAAMQAATDIVMVAPVYWYALPAPAKLLLDHWSGWFDSPETGFATWARDKTVHLITVRADPDPTVTDLPEAMLRRSITWLGMRWGGALHGVGDAAGDVLQDRDALTRAATFLT